MLTAAWVYIAELAASFRVATVASPAGVSGAVLLLAIPGWRASYPESNGHADEPALQRGGDRYWRQGQTGRALTPTRSSRLHRPGLGESGIALGFGGLIGGYTGARLQPHLPKSVIHGLLDYSFSPSVFDTPGSPLAEFCEALCRRPVVLEVFQVGPSGNTPDPTNGVLPERRWS